MGVAQNRLKRISNAWTGKNHVGLPAGSQLISSSGSQVRFRIFETFINNILGVRTMDKFMKALRRSPLVYMVVNKIASTSAAITRIYTNASGEEIENGKIEELLNNPNEKQSRIELYESANEGLLLSGNTFFYHIEGSGMGDELVVLKPNRVKIFTDKIGDVSAYKYKMPNGHTLTITDPDSVLHIKTSNLTQDQEELEQWGVSPLEAMWIVVKSSDEKFSAEASIFKNRGVANILSTDTEIPMLPNERERLQAELDNDLGGAEKFNKTHISQSRLKAIQLGMSPTDLKLLDGIVSSLRLLCAAYCVPSVIFNDTDISTYNNMVEAKKQAYLEAYIPLADKVDQKLSAWLSIRLKTDEAVKVDKTSIEELKSTANEIINKINSYDPTVGRIIVEALSINDILGTLGIDPIGAEGDRRLAEIKTQSKPKEDGSTD